jgi:hypothetical protein
MFSVEAWQEARRHFGEAPDAKQKLQNALSRISPVRNEIAHVREVEPDRLMHASVACGEIFK